MVETVADIANVSQGKVPIHLAGKEGETKLMNLVGGTANKYFSTTSGGRYVDVFANNIAHESKVGYTPASKRIIKQVEKDAELMRLGSIKAAHWHFYKSNVTGRSGPSKTLAKLLEANNIGYTIHE